MDTWKCTCGQRHTGTPLKIYPGHQPVSPWEARMTLAVDRVLRIKKGAP